MQVLSRGFYCMIRFPLPHPTKRHSLRLPQFTQASYPHPSIDEGFKTTKTNKEKEPYLSNVFQFGVSRCLFLCEQNTVPRRPLFVLIPPYKNQVKQVFVSAEHALAIPNVFHKIA